MAAAEERLVDLSVRALIDRAAEPEPEPGGGSIAALIAALAAGLATMVCSLTIGRPKYQDVSDDLERRRRRLAELRSDLTALVDEDVRAYGQVMAAYTLPKSNDEERARRDAAVAAGLIEATLTPLHLGELAAEVVDQSAVIARTGNRTARDDAILATFLAETAARGALLNVSANLRLLRTERAPADLVARAKRLHARVVALAPIVAELGN